MVEVAPSREEIDRRVAQVAAGRFRRPVLVLGIDGASVPSRPASARGRRPGPARYRARRAQWPHEWREAKGFRFYLLDGERIVHVRSWHQVYTEQQLGKALRQVKDAHLIPEETVRLCVICDGAEWRGKHVQALFPQACQVLDYYHCAEYLHKVAKAQDSDRARAGMDRGDLDPCVSGEGGACLGACGGCNPCLQKHGKRLTIAGCTSRPIGAGPTTAVAPWGLSVGEWGHGIGEQMYLSCPLETFGGVVVRGE